MEMSVSEGQSILLIAQEALMNGFSIALLLINSIERKKNQVFVDI